MDNIHQKRIYDYFSNDDELHVLFIFKDSAGEFLRQELEELGKKVEGTENEYVWPAPATEENDGNGPDIANVENAANVENEDETHYHFLSFEADKVPWFTLKYRFDHEWASPNEKVVFYFDQPSPTNQATRSQFLLMDLLVANAEYYGEDWRTYMQRNSLPDAMAAFVEKNINLLQNGKISEMIKPSINDGTISEDMATRAILSVWLGEKAVLEWDEIILDIILIGHDDPKVQKEQKNFYNKLRKNATLKERVDRLFQTNFGQEIKYNDENGRRMQQVVESFKYNLLLQNKSVNPNDTYKEKRLNQSDQIAKLNQLIAKARGGSDWAKMKETIDDLGSQIREEKILEWYGHSADYGYMTKQMSEAILSDIVNTTLIAEPIEAKKYLEEIRPKMDDEDIRKVIDYLQDVANYYDSVTTFGTLQLNTPDLYTLQYTTLWYKADQWYRLSNEKYYGSFNINALSESFYETIRIVKAKMDTNYAQATNRMNLEWTRCIRERMQMDENATGEEIISMPRQHRLYEGTIKTAVQRGKTAVIVSDALRYECAQELYQELLRERHEVTLNAALATLPTETKYCKPTIFHHEQLTFCENATPNDNNAIGAELQVDGQILDNTEKRATQVSKMVNDATCINISVLTNKSKTDQEIREMFKRPLVYVMHDTIDSNSHGGTAKEVVGSCREAIKELRTVATRMLSTWNMTEVIITSDHGFLFNDQEFAENNKHRVSDGEIEKTTRYYLTRSEAAQEGIIKFPLSKVSGMENAEGIYVAVSEGINRLAAPSGGYKFAHGGASLQEIIIPVITYHNKKNNDKTPVDVTLLNHNLKVQSSILKFTLVQSNEVNQDYKERTITVALYRNDKPVTEVREYNLNNTDPSLDKRRITITLTLNQEVPTSTVLQLKVYDENDKNNPLIIENVINATLISNDF